MDVKKGFFDLIKALPVDEVEKMSKLLDLITVSIGSTKVLHEQLDAEASGSMITLFNVAAKRHLIDRTCARLMEMHSSGLINADQYRAWGAGLAQNLMELAKNESAAIDGISGGIARHVIKDKEEKTKQEEEKKKVFETLSEAIKPEPKKSTE